MFLFLQKRLSRSLFFYQSGISFCLMHTKQPSALAVNHDPFFSETSDPHQIGDTRFVDRPYSTVAFLS